VRSTPGVVDAEAATVVPYFAAGPQLTLSGASGAGMLNAEKVVAGPRYFFTLGVTLKAGRAFNDRDVAGTPLVTVVNDAVATALWPGMDPVGRMISIEGVPHQVVGVVAGYAHNALRRVRPTVFLALAQVANAPRRMEVLVRTRLRQDDDLASQVTPSTLVQTLRREINSLGFGTVVSIAAMDDLIAAMGQEILVNAFPLVVLIATAVLLTAAGIYGVLSFAISRRTPELALRVAVGATRAHVIRMVTGHCLRLLGTGATLGIAATFALTRVAQGRGGMFDAPGWQTFAVPLLVIILVATLAAAIPLRRALSIDPARLLRVA
jgi:ABC-type antimicrobial peptide transport system permease subunit